MPATTIKLESELVRKAIAVKPKDDSLSAFVRGLIEREYRDHRLREAAGVYEAFLQRHPAEREAMEVWESAPLTDRIEPHQP
jgi:hypothetical protein